MPVMSGSVEPQGFGSGKGRRPVYIGYMRGLSPTDAAIDWWHTQMVGYCLEREVYLARIYHDWSDGKRGDTTHPSLRAALLRAGESATRGVLIADMTFPIGPSPVLAIVAEVFLALRPRVHVVTLTLGETPGLEQEGAG